MNPVSPSQPDALPDSFDDRTSRPTDTILRLEEQIRVDTRVVETGRVVIRKNVTERDETVTVPLNHDEVSVDRVVVNRYVDAPPQVRYEGDTMIIPVLEEVVVVEKRLLLVEELRVTKRQVQTQETRQVHLRKEDVTVTREVSPSADDTAPPAN